MGAISGAAVTGVVDSGDHTSYTVSVNTGTGSGTLRLDVKGTGTGIADLAGNPLGSGFTSGEEYVILRTTSYGANKYDDTHTGWSYTGGWSAYSGSEPYYNGTTHYTSTVGETALFVFSGTQFKLSYATHPLRGSLDVYVDGSKVTTINQNGALVYQNVYTSPVYASGTHVVQFKHAGGAGPFVGVDALEVLNTAAPGVGLYDDTHWNWSYTAGWTAYSGSDPYYNGTTHYTGAMGETASFTFTGAQFILTYATHPLRGDLDVYVDGNKVATVIQNGEAQLQRLYISPVYALSTHVVWFKHGGGAGPYVGVDALQVLSTAVPGAWLYDDTDPNWTYTGGWAAYSGSDPYFANTTHYTATVGEVAAFTFSGRQFKLTYATHPLRGSLEVYLDGNKVTTINQNGALVYQNIYTSPVYALGTHVVWFKHAGGAGPFVGVDALQVLP
jgi:hypothetical protein